MMRMCMKRRFWIKNEKNTRKITKNARIICIFQKFLVYLQRISCFSGLGGQQRPVITTGKIGQQLPTTANNGRDN